MKRLVCLFLLFTCLCLCCGAAVAEDALKFDSSREIAAYLDQEGVKYAVKTDRENYDLFTLTYAPSTSKELDKIAIQVYAYEDSAVVIGADLLQPDTSNLLKLYQNLESMNDSVSFVRCLWQHGGTVHLYYRAGSGPELRRHDRAVPVTRKKEGGNEP